MKNNKLTSLSIGIPAHNEEINIGHLIKDLHAQDQSGYILDKIYIYLDGCSDNTKKEIEKIKYSKIIVIDNHKQKGIAHGLNRLLSISTSNIIVILNADIRISDQNFINKLIKPILERKADLTSCTLYEVESKNLIQKILKEGMLWKELVFSHTNSGDNVYTCHGPARAFSKSLYKNIHFKFSFGEDMYSYLFAQYHGYKYAYTSTTGVYYQLPSTLSDHLKQSQRFKDSIKKMINEFGKKFVNEKFSLGHKNGLKIFLNRLFYNPIYFSLYIFLNIISISKTLWTKPIDNYNLWSIVKSSKTTINPR